MVPAQNPKATPDTGYYENERPEVAALVDESALTVLDVGCGSGVLGARLKKAVPRRRVFGIEYVPQIAETAIPKLDGIVVGDVLQIELPFEKNMFDCIIFADVLEHLASPERVLERLKPFLRKNGTIVCSIPNMRHYTVILKLLKHGWRYEEFGHFDRTHLRFFSLDSMKELLAGAGFRLETTIPRIVASAKMQFLNRLLLNRLEEFLAFQYLLKARNDGSTQV